MIFELWSVFIGGFIFGVMGAFTVSFLVENRGRLYDEQRGDSDFKDGVDEVSDGLLQGQNTSTGDCDKRIV